MCPNCWKRHENKSYANVMEDSACVTTGETLEGDYTKDTTQGDGACYVFNEWDNSQDQEWYANSTCSQRMILEAMVSGV